ncbi:MAG TPA: FkbM family methyltransferase [Longimicrobiales bacterium]
MGWGHFGRQEWRRLSHARAISKGRFGDRHDPLFLRLSEWVHPGDWVIDVGAAVGDYALELSRLVGPDGRVIAFEPMPAQFELLACNATLAKHANVTCLQLAVGSQPGTCRMSAPKIHGRSNWYEAAVSDDGDTTVLQIRLDDLYAERPIRLMKIDAEGHDLEVLRGAAEIIRRHQPALLVEAGGREVVDWLESLGYDRHISAEGSANQVHLASAPRAHQPGL